MNATSMTVADRNQWDRPRADAWGCLALIAAESAIFTHLRGGLSFLYRQEPDRPHAEGRSQRPDLLHDLFAFQQPDDSPGGESASSGKTCEFRNWWFATIALGTTFIYGTATEWHRLIYHDGLTISTNLFGTTYYSLVGLHGFHVIVGLIVSPP